MKTEIIMLVAVFALKPQASTFGESISKKSYDKEENLRGEASFKTSRKKLQIKESKKKQKKIEAEQNKQESRLFGRQLHFMGHEFI